MKLKEFNTENTINTRATNGVAVVSINTKSGLFNFNRPAVALLGLKDNDQIVILQDEEQQENWYLEKVSKKGFLLRAKTNVTTGLLFNSVALARSIAESVEFKNQTGRILIAGTPTEFSKRKLWGLLATSLTNKS